MSETTLPLTPIQRPIDLVDTAFNLYGFLPAKDDERWPFLEYYHDVRAQVGFKAMNFVNARRATYLSAIPSYPVGFVTSVSAENNLQQERALDNLSLRKVVLDRFNISQGGFESFDIRPSLTDRLTTDPTKATCAITPCPEALYQLRLFSDQQYLARVGFNLHYENAQIVMSLVNIQGRPNGVAPNARFTASNGVSPFNLLVRRAISVANAVSPSYAVRGLINPGRGNPRLYYGVLEHEGVELTHAFHKVLPASVDSEA